jgi:hypothetical protein
MHIWCSTKCQARSILSSTLPTSPQEIAKHPGSFIDTEQLVLTSSMALPRQEVGVRGLAEEVVPTSSMALPPREAGVRALTEEFVLMPSMASQEDGRALAVDVVLTSSMAWPSQEARRTALVAKNFCALT